MSAGRAKGRPPARPVLGVVVCERDGSPPFAEAFYVRSLLTAGRRFGLDVYAFSPWTWNEERRTVRAWSWDDGAGWRSEERSAPTLAYDRAWPDDPRQRERYRHGLRRMLETRSLRLLNGSLPGKAEVIRALARQPRLRKWLPPSALYRGEASLSGWLRKQDGAAFLKPSRGSQGRRVASVVRDPDGGEWTVRGRNGANRPFRLTGLRQRDALRCLDRWIGMRTYIMQPLLQLTGPAGEPFDLRLLAQRGGDGQWGATGVAVRRGRHGSVTANLHGGGEARNASSYLAETFGETRAAELLRELNEAAFAIIRQLEESYGKFAELGLDFGIDRSGRLWFLEANGKPGRAAMACAGGQAAAEAAWRPLAYARYILLRPPGRVFHEFDPV
ncbi:YheC/YheD family protein [Cohnella zeiphila]|uniref:YheC/YheD family protein n=1 Tax=Cohnella zeiphila TaxID=2761120 RepID=A0A7X0SR18_9BACL|nr:YheC/YheD family protein [Cohnella zeiphila]MBB6733529.1 YheC/YheD family protein [Cohnella zeiphila]